MAAKKKYADASSGVPLEVKNQRYLIVGSVAGVLVILLTSMMFYFSLNLEKQEDKEILVEDQVVDSGKEEIPSQVRDDNDAVEMLTRSEVSLEILNGSGVSGLAGATSEQFEELGYENIEIGNADSAEETTIIASENYSEVELKNILEDIQRILEVDEISSFEDLDTDLKIILGEDQS